MYTLITQTQNIVRHLDNPDYYDQINEILGKKKPYLSKRFMSIMGILIAIKRNLASNLIAIKESGLNYERKIDLLTNFEEISIDFPKKMLEKGKAMTEVYFNLFIFENYIRNFIEEVSIKAYGKNYWEKLSIKINIKNKIVSRKKNESLYKWLSTRGDSDLYYTDFDELRVIISNNWEIFQMHFPKETWIITYLEDLYKIRNKIAHNIPIEESEKNTVKTHINNIYNQLEVNLKYVKFYSEVSAQYLLEEDEDDYYYEEKGKHPELYKVDFELTFNYLDMIEKGDIPYDNLNSTFHTIGRELQKLKRTEDIDQQELAKLENICKRLLSYMKDVDDKIEQRVLEVFHSFTFNEKTAGILKNHGYAFFIKLFEMEKYHTDLLRILDLFGYFDNKIENLLVSAIKNNNARFLNSFLVSINFSRHKGIRINIIRTLNHQLAKVASNNKNLKDAIKNIIWKFE